MPRAFSAAEHQAWAELAAENRLDDLAAAVDANMGIGGGTTREKLLAGDIAQHEARYTPYLTEDGGAPRPELTEAERLEAYALAATIDDLKARADNIKSERIARALILQNQHLEAVQTALIQFMHFVLQRDDVPVPDLAEFAQAVTDEDLSVIESAVAAGKLPTGLSALSRRERGTYQLARQLVQRAEAETKRGSGSASGSTLEPQASPRKTGTTRRSKKPSSRSKQPS